MDLPRYSMSPPAEGWMPVTAFSVVVLPAPFAPIRLTSSPSRTSKLAPLTAWMPPLATRKPSTWSNALVAMDVPAPRRSMRLVSGAEVGLDHLRVVLHLRGGALGDL